MTMSGCPIESMEINVHTLSELLRLYVEDRAEPESTMQQVRTHVHY